MGTRVANPAAFPKLLDACQAVVERWEHGDLAEAACMCSDAVNMALGLGDYSPDPCDGLPKETRQIEYYRLWPGNSGDSGTWDTDFIDIPADTPNDKVDEAIRKAAAKVKWRDSPPVIVGCYCDSDREEEDEDDKASSMTPEDREQTIHTLLSKAEKAGLQPEDLDETVHDLAGSIAADVNNEGLHGQLGYLIDQLGVQEATRQLDRLAEKKSEASDHE